MISRNPKIFVSYSHADIELARQIQRDISPLPLDIVRDERSTQFSDDLESYMKLIRKTDYALILVSHAFLCSTACMFEVTEFLKDEDHQTRILPIVIEDYEKNGEQKRGANIYNHDGVTHYIAYWEKREEMLQIKTRSVNPANSLHLVEELRKVRLICRTIGDFISIVKRLKHVTQTVLIQDGYKPLLDRIGYKNITVSDIRQAEDFYTQAMNQVTLEKRLYFLDKAIERNPYHVDAHQQRGKVFDERKDFSEAISNYTRAIELVPERQSSYVNRSYSFIRRGELEKALSDLTIALDMNPECKVTYNNRADVYYRMGKHDLAEKDIQTALAFDPEFDLAYATLAELRAAQGNREDFYQNLRTAISFGYPLHKYDYDEMYSPFRDEDEFKALLEESRKGNNRFI